MTSVIFFIKIKDILDKIKKYERYNLSYEENTVSFSFFPFFILFYISSVCVRVNVCPNVFVS